MPCRYYNNLTGLKGECRGGPTKLVNSQWEYPIVEHGCHCRFYDDGKPIIAITPVEDVKLSARQKALAKKKAQQDDLKNSQS